MKALSILKISFISFVLLSFITIQSKVYAQKKDSVQVTSFSIDSSSLGKDTLDLTKKKRDSIQQQGFSPQIKLNWDSLRQVHSPRRAGLYSAIFPGLGQIYNHQYIKVPFMLAGIGVATGVFIFNFNHYTKFRDAYRLRLNGRKTGNPDIDVYNAEGLKYLRDGYRKYVDYSVLGFAAVYLYNIIDAVVFGYLYDFNVDAPIAKVKFGPVLHKEGPYVGLGFTYNF